MPPKLNPAWPVLTHYDQDHLSRIALPLGGIGTGTVCLGGRGDLRDWEVVNRPAKGFTPERAFFALYAKPAGGPPAARVIEGPVEAHDYEGQMGAKARSHGLPRFRNCSFHAAYPFGQVLLSDPDVPLQVRIEAFNPLVPPDADASGIPVAILRFVLTNPTRRAVAASVCGSIQNFIGHDAPAAEPRQNVNTFRRTSKPVALQGLSMHSKGLDPYAESFGTLALSTTSTSGVTHRTAWTEAGWQGGLLDFWDDFSHDGKLEPRKASGQGQPLASLAVSLTVPPRAAKAVTFLLTWHFPNRRTWTPAQQNAQTDCCERDHDRIGNYYTTQYTDAWDVARRTAAKLRRLEADSLQFVRAFCNTDLPDVVKEAALYNLSTLRTQTCFRTPDGRFYGWEGCCDGRGCCHGSCTHVWNYEQTTAYVFGSLAKRMREVEFAHCTSDIGHMSFRANLPIDRAQQFALAAADGQMGCLMKLYRDWQLSGDDDMLAALWPKARKAIEFCWVKGGWDADQDGVMEGCQHNTMDVEYYGPNPQMGTWYLGALRAGEEMARYVGEHDFADTCRRLFDRGSRWMDEHLFNGEYYEHEIRPPRSDAAIAPGLRHQTMGAQDLANPELQLGAGCLVDQLVGQFVAHVCGLGHLLKPAHVRKTLRGIMKHNFRESFFGHFNNMRSFVLNDEAGLLMATYPRGRRPTRPFPYFSEVMTGFEYAAAVGMLYEGQTANGLKCIKAIRGRYDGRKRSPFDEAECGHHYARAMASWAGVLALTGFRYSGVDQVMEFAASGKPTRWFWSNGSAWGTFEQRPTATGASLTLKVLRGKLRLKRLTLKGLGSAEFRPPRRVSAGRVLKCTIHHSP